MANYVDDKPENIVCIPEFNLEQLLPEDSTTNLPGTMQKYETKFETGKWCIIQQWSSLNSFAHAIKYIENSKLNTYPQAIVFIGINYELAFARLQQLRIQCSAQVSKIINPVDNSYMLVQLFYDASMISYEIVDTKFLRDQCVLSYCDHPVFGSICLLYDKLKASGMQYMKILRVAQSEKDLARYLYTISIYALNNNDNSTISNNVQSTLVPYSQQTQYATYKNIKNELLNTLNTLDQRESIAKQQCSMLVEIMDQVREIRKKLERKISRLERRILSENKA